MTTSRQPPAAYLTEDTSFPYGPFRPETPKEVYLAAGLASRLEYALRRYSVRYIAKNASLNPQTIHNLLNGESWPDLRTLARLEIVFNCLLWGYEHRRSPEDYYRNYGMDHRGYPKTPRNYLKAPPVLRHTQRGASTSRRPENPGSAYEKQINDLVSSWREEVYDGVLVQQVRSAVSMYAYASLQKVTDVYHVPSTFPLFSEARGEERRDLWKAQVQAHADEGRARDGLARFMHFQNAIQLAEKHGLKGLANELQQEAGPLSEDSLQRLETETEIPAAKIEAYIGFVVGDDNPSNALRRFGGDTPSGDPTQNRAFAQNLMNESPLRSLVTNLITGNQGELVKQFQTREEYEDYQVVAIETQQINFFAGLAVHILKEIKQRYGAIGADASVFESDLVDETQAEWIALAVRHFEAGDYRSSVSVMAPRLENAIRSIARKAGINLFRDSLGGRQTSGVKALGKVLSELEDRIPEATRRYWSTLLTNPLGLDLRNKVSHGLLDHPSPQEAAVLFHAACHLLVLESQPPSDGQR